MHATAADEQDAESVSHMMSARTKDAQMVIVEIVSIMMSVASPASALMPVNLILIFMGLTAVMIVGYRNAAKTGRTAA